MEVTPNKPSPRHKRRRPRQKPRMSKKNQLQPQSTMAQRKRRKRKLEAEQKLRRVKRELQVVDQPLPHSLNRESRRRKKQREY